MRLDDLLGVLRQLAPEGLAEPWDKVGLHLGDPARAVRRAMLCIDLTAAVLDEAIAARAGLIVVYHPVIFEPLASLTAAGQGRGAGRGTLVLRAAEARIALYCPHTALDAAPGGLNDWLAGAVAAADIRPIRPAPGADGGYKLITFVPPQHADALRRALSRAGAGVIGDYTECSFNAPGFGTFLGGAGSRPTIGRAGRFERVAELRIEMVCTSNRLPEVVAALRQAHPYEAPAFDLIRLQADPTAAGPLAGQGRVATLARAMSLRELAWRIGRRLGVRRLEIAAPPTAAGRRSRSIRRIGFVAGAGGSLLGQAGDLDAFVTGEMRHHDVLAAAQRGTAVLLAGHTQTERPYLPEYRRRLRVAGAGRVEWLISRADRPPSASRGR